MRYRNPYFIGLIFSKVLLVAGCSSIPVFDSIQLDEVTKDNSFYLKFNSEGKRMIGSETIPPQDSIEQFRKGLAISELHQSRQINKKSLDIFVTINWVINNPFEKYIANIFQILTLNLFSTVDIGEQRITIEIRNETELLYTKEYKKKVFHQNINSMDIRYFFYNDFLDFKEYQRKAFEYYGAVVQRDITYYVLSECYGPNSRKTQASICKAIK